MFIVDYFKFSIFWVTSVLVTGVYENGVGASHTVYLRNIFCYFFIIVIVIVLDL